MRWFRRLAVVALLVGAVALVLDRRRRLAAPPAAPIWPATSAPIAAPAPTWVPSVDGACPEGYPVKANDNSGIYHVPGGRFYDRTEPERCYATSADAERDGYRAAKA